MPWPPASLGRQRDGSGGCCTTCVTSLGRYGKPAQDGPRIASRNSRVGSLVVGARHTRASRPGLPDASGSALGASSLQTFGTPTVSHFLASGVAWGPAFDDRRARWPS